MRSVPVSVCLPLLLCFQLVSADERILFLRHTIDSENRNSACCLIDVNRDGRSDIVSGNFWYEAPLWGRHHVRSVEVIRGRQDDYSNLVLDVNNDGFQDIVSANYRSQSLYWIQNPGTQKDPDAEWSRHVIETPGAMETGRLADVNDDGVPDILPNGTTFASWWSLKVGSIPAWQRHPLPHELAGHGIGIGDINGDGRSDVVGPTGWAEAPNDRAQERWTFHAEFLLGRDASVPIQVVDVDQDGDRDIVWGRGHQVGVYWLEQIPAGGQTSRSWMRHAIETQSGQNHSPLWLDLDGNGRKEFVTGSRFMAHEGKDIGEANPLTVISLEFVPADRSWRRRLVSQNALVGFGVDPQAADVDVDGDIDLVCADLSGLFLLENRTVTGTESFLSMRSAAAVPAIDETVIESGTYVHTDLGTVLKHGELQPLQTPFDAGIRREHILQGMSLAMGELPDSDRRCPLDVQIHSSETVNGYIRQRISYAPEPGDRVPAWLLLPGTEVAPGAAMLCLHQTTGIGKGEPIGAGGLENLHYAHELAMRSFVCLVPDYPSFGDYPWDFKTQGQHYASGTMKAIWNNVRAVDLLQSLPQVHPDRIGCIGHSLGGHNTLFTAAFDQRLKAVVTSCGFTGFHDYYQGALAGWTSDRYMPRIRDVYKNDADKVPFDFQEVLAAIAPRAVFVSAPVNDNNFEHAGVLKVIDEVAKIYRLYGAAETQLATEYPDCAHDFPDETRERAYQWLEQCLK